ncbi:MAG: class I tRNA ligase family protein, partial [Nitrososphaerota archaeon]
MPHLGTLIGSVLSADVFARYLRLRGEEVLFVSGSDEHGTPIEIEAIKRRVHPKTLTDEVHSLVTDLFKRFSISFDNYTRTHNDIHINFCRELFLRIYEKGFIYARDVDQLFCETCKRFLPDRFVIGTCPKCGYPSARGDQCENCGIVLEPLELVDYRCSICGSIPVIKKTKHWYFDLPRFSEKLRTMILNNDRLPENAKNFSLSWINEG